MDFLACAKKFSLLDNLPLGAFVIDESYTIIIWNPCIASWTGINADSILGRQLTDIYPHFAQEMYLSRIDPILQGGPPTIFSSQLHGHLFPSTLPSGRKRIFETTVSNIPGDNEDEFYALFVMKDVTELSYRIVEFRKVAQQNLEEIEQRKIVEAELRKANEKILAQTKAVIEEERLKVLLQMVGATASELDQPLMHLLANIELLESEPKAPKSFGKRIEAIGKTGRLISDSLKKMQHFGHVARDVPEPKIDAGHIYGERQFLCVDSDPASFGTLEAMLTRCGYDNPRHAPTLEQAFTLLEKETFNLVFLDYQFPDGDAFDMLNFIKKKDIQVPLIVLSGQGDELVVSRLFKAGVTDYLPKTFLNKKSLGDSISFSLEKYHFKRDKDRALRVMGDLSTKDGLTGLYNRRYFMEALERETSGTERYARPLALCLMDIDFFKKVNDSYGHNVGDKVLKQIAKFILAALRKYDIPCRYGGEEFGLLLPNTEQQGAWAVCERIRQSVEAHQFEYEGFSFKITLSAGIALRHCGREFNVDKEILKETFVKQADLALYQAKAQGRNRIILA